MNIKQKLIVSLSAIGLTLGFAACGGGNACEDAAQAACDCIEDEAQKTACNELLDAAKAAADEAGTEAECTGEAERVAQCALDNGDAFCAAQTGSVAADNAYAACVADTGDGDGTDEE